MLKLLLIIGLLLCLVVGWYVWRKSNQSDQSPTSQVSTTIQWSDRELRQISLGGQQLTVEVVTQPASITRGLGGRAQLGSDGMLFVLPKTQATSFWMKGMQFDLDLIWLKNRQVIGINQQVPALPQSVSDTELPLYYSPGEVDMVLEVDAGKSAEWQIVPGTNLELR